MHPFRTALLFLFVLGTRGLFADANSTKISAAEYFVDTDPGEGSGTALSAQDGTFDSEVESIAPVDLNVTGLAVGPHLIGIRYKDDNNTWGEVLYQTIHVYDANPDANGSGGGGSSGGFATIKAAEYFVDTDPGEGNGTAFQAQDGAFDSEVESILPKDLNVTGLAVGPHLVGVRYQDNNNTWGEVLFQTIHVYDANPSGSGSGGSGSGGGAGSSGGFATIQAAEYFVDTDPGEGNGTAFQAQDGAFDSEVESILPKDLNVTGLAVGPHLVGVRYQDNNNTWGEVLYQTIHVYDANPDINNGGSGGSGGTGGFTVIAGAEYFIGNDPGEGNATALQPKDGAFDSEVESTLTATLSLEGYAIGAYLVGVRYKDNNNTWGDVLFKTIEVDVDTDGDGLADKAEIYYETNSTVQDTDGDGYLDGEEVAFGSDPTDASSLGNRAPTDLNSTDNLKVLENLPSFHIFGEFNATDSDLNGSLRYEFVDGVGSADNALFALESNGILKTKSILNVAMGINKSVRVAVYDDKNSSMEKSFTIMIEEMDKGVAPTKGSGSSSEPYQIETLSHLNWLSHHSGAWSKSFKLMNDIDASTTKDWAAGYGFSPIGNSNIRFSGNFNGQGHTIFGLSINRLYMASVGMFGHLKAGSISNLYIKKASVKGSSLVGGIVGNLQGSSILNCSFDGNVSALGQKLGGLVGMSQVNSTIRSCFTSGNVVGTGSRIGGMLGQNFTNSKVVDSYSLSKVSGLNSAGGLVGLNTGGTYVYNTYSVGVVDTKGLIGSNYGIVSNSFWDIQSSQKSASSGGFGRNTEQMMNPSTFLDAGWDFNQTGGTWKMIAGQTYPRLAWENTATTLPYDLNSTTPLKVLENQPVGTVIGQFTAKHLGVPSVLEFSLVGQGGANQHIEYDNDFFSMDKNGTLRTAVILDYEANSTLTINARVNDGNLSNHIVKLFTVQVVNVVEDLDQDGIEDAFDTDIDGDGYSNVIERAYPSDPLDANSVADTLPTALTLSSLEIMENKPVGTIVGQFTVIDPDINDSHIIKFNDINENISHNHLFTIDANNTLRTAVVFDYENNSSTLYLRVKAKQNQVGVFWEFFTLSLLDDSSDNKPTYQTPTGGYQTPDGNYSSPDSGYQSPDSEYQSPGGSSPIDDQNETTPPKLKEIFLPILQTLVAQTDGNGTHHLTGKVLTDGGSPVFEAGFLVSKKISLSDPIRITATLESNATQYHASISDLSPNTTYYFRAYAINQEGQNLGALKKFHTALQIDSNTWYFRTKALPGGWRKSNWFGAFQPTEHQWLYHSEMGWLYPSPMVDGSLWLWNQADGWRWTQEGVYPYLFRWRDSAWIYLQGRISGRLIYYNYSTQSYE